MAFNTLYFIRHGETDMNVEQRCQGRIDAPLNDRGRAQSALAAEEFAGKRIDKLYTSPLGRATYAADLIARGRGIKAAPLEWLMEIDHGELEGMDRRQCEEVRPGMIADWFERPDTVYFPGGESLFDMERRVARGLWETYNRDSGDIVFVTHQVVTAVARCIFQGRPLAEAWGGKLGNGKYLEIKPDMEMLHRLEITAGRETQKEAVK